MNPGVAWYLIIMETKASCQPRLSAPFVNAVFDWDSPALLPRGVGMDKGSGMYDHIEG